MVYSGKLKNCKEELYDLFMNKNMRISDIARKLNVTTAAIRYNLLKILDKKFYTKQVKINDHLNSACYKRRNERRREPLKQMPGKLKDKKKEVIDLFMNKKLSIANIADILSVHSTAISKYLTRLWGKSAYTDQNKYNKEWRVNGKSNNHRTITDS